MALVEHMGAVYRVSAKRYRKMLLDVANGEDIVVESYGRPVGVIDCYFGDFTADEARYELEALGEPEVRRRTD